MALRRLLDGGSPLSVLLPHVTASSASLAGTAPAEQAAEEYHDALERFCCALNPSDEASDLPSSSALPLPADDAWLRVPRALLRGPYDDAIARAKASSQILMVVLESGPHQGTERFRKETLLNPHLDSLLVQEDILLWAADVGGRDGTQVAQLLQATQYPFVAFISAQPKPSSTSGARTRMSVLSRHEGLRSVGLATLSEHIRTVLVPRVGGYLARLRREQAAHTVRQHTLERHRQQQERYAHALRQDQNEDTDHRPLKCQQEQSTLSPLASSRSQYAVWRRWAASPERAPDPRLPRPIDQHNSDIATFDIQLPSAKTIALNLPLSAPVEALFVAIELDSPLPSMGEEDSLPPGDASTPPRWPNYNFSLCLPGRHSEEKLTSTKETLTLPISRSGLVGPEEPDEGQSEGEDPSRLNRITLLVDGTPGWHTQSYHE